MAVSKKTSLSCCGVSTDTPSCCGSVAEEEETMPSAGGGCCGKQSSNDNDISCCSVSPPKTAPEPCCNNNSICNSEPPAAKSCCDESSDCCGVKQKSCCDEDVKTDIDVCCPPKIAAKNMCCSDEGCSANCASSCCKEDVTAMKKSCCGAGGIVEGEGVDDISGTSCCPPKNETKECCSSSKCVCIPVTTASCCSTNGCCADSPDDSKKHLTCLAVIRPDNVTVDVFDVKGHSRAFRSKNKILNNKLLSNKLCFSAHGAGENIDGMLTYCFDANGEHGEPDEVCFCGEEEPHLHAHIHDPELCGDDNCDGGVKTEHVGKQKTTNWRFLSQLTLHLVDDDEENSPKGVASMPVTSSMPNQCNSSTLQQHLSDKGLQLVQRECCDDDETKNECGKHRMYKVQHHDHTDYLVHNEASGQLHMEHPCVSCGDNDVHGRFRLLHTRSWMGDESSRSKGKDKSREIRLHFFEAHQEPFHLLDVFSAI